jgi:hypothetical protein
MYTFRSIGVACHHKVSNFVDSNNFTQIDKALLRSHNEYK